MDHSLTADSLCYCAGAGEDISFECALVERYGCRVRIIDPTPRATQHFHDAGETKTGHGKVLIGFLQIDEGTRHMGRVLRKKEFHFGVFVG